MSCTESSGAAETVRIAWSEGNQAVVSYPCGDGAPPESADVFKRLIQTLAAEWIGVVPSALSQNENALAFVRKTFTELAESKRNRLVAWHAPEGVVLVLGQDRKCDLVNLVEAGTISQMLGKISERMALRREAAFVELFTSPKLISNNRPTPASDRSVQRDPNAPHPAS